MSKRNILEIVVVGFGLYCIFTALQRLPQGLISIWSYTKDFNIEQKVWQFYSILLPILYLTIGFLLIFKVRSVASFLDSRTTPSVPADRNETGWGLSFWMTLIGLYYLVPSAATVFTAIIFAYNEKDLAFGQALMKSGILAGSQFFILILSLLLILLSPRIEKLILRLRQKRFSDVFKM